MTVKPMKWTTKENVKIGKMWYIVDRTLTDTGEIDKDDLVISPFQLKAHLEKLRKQAKEMGMDPKLVPFEFGNNKYDEFRYQSWLKWERKRELERQKEKEREMER
ncbi:MAG: hypothetical protein IOB85_10130 [Methylobacterium sp.]|nr:hypothetical protein [Cupriavidus sp.]MCA3671912.1 hypothetical protein [Methylobacterium sp.]MCA3676854.1 hypothetical protein [Methylobacterium sp.]MCA3681290.1 hypothetical protein [Methylobacterium sp.]MCA3682606.1 hypothetical protein [Methylobacterium sp.]